MTARREEANFKQKLEDLIAGFEARAAPTAPAPFVGAGDDAPLEHAARKFFLDRLLEALGWDIGVFEGSIVEEARVQSETTVFLDYLGAHPQSRAPLMIFEAKAWEKPFVTRSSAAVAKETANNRLTEGELIALALEHCKSGEAKEKCPVTQEWRGWLLKLIEYVTALRDQSGHSVSRVAISSGQWLVVFLNPENAFIRLGLPDEDQILLFRTDDYVSRSADIYGVLAREYLIRDTPQYISPAQITAHLSVAAAKKLFRGVWVRRVSTGSDFDVHPQILVYPAAVVQRSDEQFVTIVDRGLGSVELPNDACAIVQHLNTAAQLSDQLLTAIDAALPGLPRPAPISEFAGFLPSPSRAVSIATVFQPPDVGVDFLRPFPATGGQFLLVTGQSSHFILAAPRIAACAGHEWAVCKSVNEEVGSGPVVGRSVDPKSFFYSGELHHCAHRGVHGPREVRCKIQAFENFLCCQACIFQSICWTGANNLPCGMAAPMLQVPAVQPSEDAELS